MPAVRQTSFAAGELSPSLWGRHDLPLYAHGLRRCVNFMITKQGNAISRPGTTFVAETETGSRLIPFVFSADDALVVEFRDKAIRFHKGGQPIKKGGKVYEIESPFTRSQLYNIRYVQMGNVLLLTCAGGAGEHRAPRELIRRADDDWELRAVKFERPEHGLKYGGGEGPIVALREEEWNIGLTGEGKGGNWKEYQGLTKGRIDGPQGDAERAILEHGTVYRAKTLPKAKRPKALEPDDLLIRLYALPLAFSKAEEATMPRHEWIHLVTVVREIEGTRIESQPYRIAYIRRATSNPARDREDPRTFLRKFANDDERRLLLHPSRALRINTIGLPFEDAKAIRFYRGRDGVFGFLGEVQRAVESGLPSDLVTWFPGFSDEGQEPDYFRSPPAGTAPTKAGGQPVALTFYEQRLLFGGHLDKPEQIWASATNDFLDFDIKNLPLASSSLKLELASRRREAIQHLLGLDRLLVFTTSSIWAVEGAGGAPLSATDLPQARVQMEVGCSEIPPLLVDSSILFVPPGKSTIRDLFFDWNQRSYTGRNIAQTAEHLLRGRQIRDWAYAAVPHEQVWVSTDSKEAPLLSLTYDRESGFVAWAQHKIGTEVRSVCVVPEDGRDVVYLTVARTIGGTTRRFIERMDPGGPRVANLDCRLPHPDEEHDGASPLRVPNHLTKAEELHAIVGGAAVSFRPGEVVTAKGKITAVGIRFQPEMELLDLASDSTRTKNVKQVFFEVEATKGLWVGETFERLTEWRQRTVADGFGAPGPHTGEAAVRIGSTWNKKGRAVLRQVDPFPITVYGVTREVEFGG